MSSDKTQSVGMVPATDPSVVRLESEVDKAARHKQALSNAMLVVCAVAEEARRDGFYVEFGLGMDQFGRYVINPPAAILKRY